MIVINRKERDRLMRRQDILTAAERVFAVRGYHKATIQDIAREAQYATGTVYLYFKDKESLYFSLIDGKIGEMVTLIREKTSGVRDAGKKLEMFVEETFGYFERNQDFFRILIPELNRLQWTIDARSSRISRLDNLLFVNEIIKAGQEQKLIRDDFPAAQLSDALGSMIRMVIFDYLKQRHGTKDLKDMSGFVLEMFLNGARKR